MSSRHGDIIDGNSRAYTRAELENPMYALFDAGVGRVRLIETYTDTALETKKRDDAQQAQSQMLELFRQRNVVQPVIDEIEHQVNELK